MSPYGDSTFGVPKIVGDKLRLTDSSAWVNTLASLKNLSFPGANNKVVVEFDHYAYSGSGADGMVLVFSDADVTPDPGGYGGSLGYAQFYNTAGFAGGWLGVGIDEFGNFANDQQRRGDGDNVPYDKVSDSVTVRGSGSGTVGYYLHGNSGKLDPGIDDRNSDTASYGYRYRVTVDHTDNVHAYVTVERDIGSGYQGVIATYDALAVANQAAVPDNWLLSLTGSTGSAKSIHEIDNLQVCATYMDGLDTSIDHYRISHDGSGLTCSPEDMTVKACMDSDCSTTYSGDVMATLTATPTTGAGWSSEQTFASDESDNASYRWTEAGRVTLGASGSGEYAAANSTRCFIGTVEQGDCSMTFYDSGFIFGVAGDLSAGVPDHVAAAEQSIILSAVRKDDDTEKCVPGFEGGDRTLNLSYGYNNPDNGTLPVYIDNKSLDDLEIRTLTFNDYGQTPLTLSYADVGEMVLTASYTGSAATEDEGLAMTGSDIFVTYPDHFNVTVLGNPAAAAASGAVFTRAGMDFSVEVAAINAVGAVTPNYGQESDPGPENVSLTSSLIAPSGQQNPALVGSFDAFGSDCAGDSSGGYACGTFRWPEVGIIQLTPEIADGEYLDTDVNVTGATSANVGRFIPDRLTINDYNTPSFDHACSGGFTYLGQPFLFLSDHWLELIAVAVDGSTTENYGGSFWRYSSSLADRAYSHSPSSDGYIVSIDTPGSVSLTGAEDYDGMGEMTLFGEQLVYTKPSTATEPFVTTIDLTLAASDLTDSDGVCYDADDDGDCDAFTFTAIGDTQQRYGRMRIQNVYGPETLDLELSILIEYYRGGYILNTDDSCTELDAIYVSLDNFTGNLAEGETSISGSGILSSGLSTGFSLLAPGDDNDGSVDVTYSLASGGSGMHWLQHDWDGDGVADNPTGRAIFGIYQGNPHLIYMRESVW
jgi:MSHA biogenesis protein MshQ